MAVVPSRGAFVSSRRIGALVLGLMAQPSGSFSLKWLASPFVAAMEQPPSVNCLRLRRQMTPLSGAELAWPADRRAYPRITVHRH